MMIKNFEIAKRIRNNISKAILFFCSVSSFSLVVINIAYAVENVQSPMLECELIAKPTQISEGQDIFVEVAVSNTGQVTVKNVVPELTIEGDGFVELIGNPPCNADIEPGAGHTFRWRYATAEGKSAGNIIFIGQTEGVNEFSGEIVESKGCESNQIRIQQPAGVVITEIIAKPGQINEGQEFIEFYTPRISEGQQISVQMEVKNESPKEKKERATAEVTAPKELDIIGTGRAILLSPNKPQVAEIPGGGTQLFQWVYVTTSDEPRSAGTINFKASVTGIDQNSKLPIKSNEMTSNSVMIQRPATLKCEATIAQPQPDESGNYQISEGQSITLEIKVTNNDDVVDANSTQARAIGVQPKVELTGTVKADLFKQPEPITLTAGSSHIFSLTYTNAQLTSVTEGVATIGFIISVTGLDANDSQRNLFCPSPLSFTVDVVSRPAIEITKIEAHKVSSESKLIGIEQDFDVIVSIKNKGKAAATITPSSEDLSLPEEQYVVRPPGRLELTEGPAQSITYKLQTIKNKTLSGKVTVKLKQLDIVDKNEPTKKIGYNESPDARDNIELDMESPKLTNVLYQDSNRDGEVEQGEKLILTFSEPVMNVNDVSEKELLEYFVLSPGNNTFGKEPNFFFEEGKIIITLGNEPVLSPEGEYGRDGTKPSGLGIEVRGSYIIDEAGNIPLDSPILDIDIEDDEKPTISTAFQEGDKTSAIPTFEFHIRDEGASFDSGINLETLEFKLGDSPREWRLIKELTESSQDSTLVTIATVGIFEPQSVIIPTSLPIVQQLRKDIRLKVTFDKQRPLSEGKYELEVIIRDNKGNKASKEIGFVVSREPGTIIDLATYPNPFAIGKEAVIRYILSEDVNDVTINIYDVAGRLVWTRKTSGTNGLNDGIRWDGRTKRGNEVSVGIYICELIAGGDKKYWRIAVRPPE
ncbi:T9SS type A sorting domain-containing protein [Candidatus Poribacteria bacterium]|nr:T9SS type A sorting domain-containing protein [Candidatus Poribacteria bacterium]